MLLRGSRWRRCWADAGKSAQPGFLGLDAAARAVHAAKGEEGVRLSCKMSTRAARSSTTMHTCTQFARAWPHAFTATCTQNPLHSLPTLPPALQASLTTCTSTSPSTTLCATPPSSWTLAAPWVSGRVGGGGVRWGVLCHCCTQNPMGKPVPYREIGCSVGACCLAAGPGPAAGSHAARSCPRAPPNPPPTTHTHLTPQTRAPQA